MIGCEGSRRASLITDRREIGYGRLVVAPGRKGFAFLQQLMDRLGVPYVDNVVDIGLRLEMREDELPHRARTSTIRSSSSRRRCAPSAPTAARRTW